jgi:hypothetical protein|tara:strand:+ start:291 stop:635 length:345 start_codon:yes stop_codon:yes gene_type:complete
MSDSLDKQQKNTDKRLENLKPRWKKGESGNPNGRPKKGTAIADILNAKGNELNENGLTNKEIMLNKVYEKALNHSDRWSVQFICDRTEGRAIERRVDVSDEWKEVVKEAYKPES